MLNYISLSKNKVENQKRKFMECSADKYISSLFQHSRNFHITNNYVVRKRQTSAVSTTPC